MSLNEVSLQAVYGALAPAMEERFRRLEKAFGDFAGHAPERFYRAPGRVEIGGNHTDHQGGVTLSASIQLDMAAAVCPRDDGIVCLQSEGFPLIRFPLADCAPRAGEEGTTAALIRGMAAGAAAMGITLPPAGEGGFDAFVSGAVPPGSGLSSSAAFEILIGTVLADLYGETAPSPLILAQTAQKTENVYFGKPCGLLDQLSSAWGGIISVDFSREEPWIRRVSRDLATTGYRLAIVASGAGHENLTEEYAAITRECGEIAAHFGCRRLCEVPEADFMAQIPVLREKAGDRAVLRALHVYEENRRALAEALCLEKGDMDGFLRLVNASGRSSAMYLQNLIPHGAVRHQELLLAQGICEHALRGKGAVRVHGGGFGGTAEAFVPEEKWESFVREVGSVFGEGSVTELVITPIGGARLKLS